MSDEPLVAHSLAEIDFYLMATPCASCGRGPLVASDTRPESVANEQDSAPRHWRVKATCNACESTSSVTFVLSTGIEPEEKGGAGTVNSGDEPSRIVDVGQWIMLHRVLLEAAGKETDKVRARELSIDAAMCLEEALKFYDDVDNDLPPPEAFFTDASRQRVRDAPEQFSKRRLVELHAKLPRVSAVRNARADEGGGKRWWRRRQ